MGRDKILAQLQQSILTEKTSSFYALTGVPGIGKTASATVLTHTKEILEYFTGGILWATLGAKANVNELLKDWASELGLYDSDDSLDKHCDQIQGTIGNRRMLIVIDDVRDVENALWFKFGNPHCIHLLTTRDERVAREFAESKNCLMLPELDSSQGEQLVSQFAGWVVEKFSNDVRDIIQAIGGLPLALLLIGKYLQKEGKSQQSCFIVQALERLKVLAQQGTEILIADLSKDLKDSV